MREFEYLTRQQRVISLIVVPRTTYHVPRTTYHVPRTKNPPCGGFFVLKQGLRLHHVHAAHTAHTAHATTRMHGFLFLRLLCHHDLGGQ